MLIEFITKRLVNARYKILDNGTYFGEIPGLPGVWANAKNLERCREELREVLEDWLVLKIRDQESIPGFSAHLRHRATPQYAKERVMA